MASQSSGGNPLSDSRLKAVAVLTILVFMLTMPLAATGANEPAPLEAALSTTPHPIISVSNDTQLSELIASSGWSGSGTEGDPYVIEGLDIDAQGATNAIFIGGTAQHLTIRGCFLHNTTYLFGSFPFNGNCGATIYNASNVTLEQNVCTGHGRGLALYQSTNVTIRNNTCYGNVHGIGLYFSHGNSLMGNNCTSDGTDGIHFEDSPSNVLDGNRCIQNGRFGICLTGNCNTNVLSNNTLVNNSDAGIRLSGASNLNRVVGNLAIGNQGYGINIQSSNGNEIYGNTISENRGATSDFNASRVQGYDNGNNRWNSTTNGNRWGDWTGPDANRDGLVDVAYTIDGGANHDQLPMAPMSILISHPMEAETVNASTVVVSGIAYPNCPLSINGALVYVGPDGSFSYQLSLFEGRNLVEVRSLHPLGTVIAFVNVTYFNELRAELEELKGRVDGLTDALNGAMDGLDAAMENITLLDADLNDTQAQLNGTRGWLRSVEDQLSDCYDDLNLTDEEVDSLLDQVAALKASLIDLRDSLNLTDEQAAALEGALDAAIADLSSAEDHLETLRSDVDGLQEDRLPLILGLAGLAVGVLSLVLLALVYTRRIKLH